MRHDGQRKIQKTSAIGLQSLHAARAHREAGGIGLGGTAYTKHAARRRLEKAEAGGAR